MIFVKKQLKVNCIYITTRKVKIKKVKFYLDINFFLLNICAQKVHNLLTMLSRKVEGLDPMKP